MTGLRAEVFGRPATFVSTVGLDEARVPAYIRKPEVLRPGKAWIWSSANTPAPSAPESPSLCERGPLRSPPTSPRPLEAWATMLESSLVNARF